MDSPQRVSFILQISMIQGARILITSRHLFKICRVKMSTYKVQQLQIEAAVKLLTSKADIGEGLAADLAEACGAAPLALEMIASLIKENQSKPEYILTELRRGKVIKLLSPDYLGSSEKLMTCIMTSYRSLDACLRCAFVSLGVFPRSFGTEAAATVLGFSHGDTRENVLEPLGRRSLLQYDARTERWSLHVLTRAFAREVRDTDPAVSHVSKCETDLHRFCVYFTVFLRGKVLDYAQSTVQCIQRCELERFNILETLRLASNPRFYPEFLPLTDAATGEQLSPLLASLLPVEDLIEFYKNCLKVAQQHGNLQRQLTLICLLGNVYISSINCTFTTLPEGPGEDCVSRALRIIQKLGGQWSAELAHCLRMLGLLEFELLQFQPALQHLSEALGMQEALQECPAVTAATLIALAKVKLGGLKRPEHAAEDLSRAERLLRDLVSKIEIPKLWFLNVILAETLKMQAHVFLAQNEVSCTRMPRDECGARHVLTRAHIYPPVPYLVKRAGGGVHKFIGLALSLSLLQPPFLFTYFLSLPTHGWLSQTEAVRANRAGEFMIEDNVVQKLNPYFSSDSHSASRLQIALFALLSGATPSCVLRWWGFVCCKLICADVIFSGSQWKPSGCSKKRTNWGRSSRRSTRTIASWLTASLAAGCCSAVPTRPWSATGRAWACGERCAAWKCPSTWKWSPTSTSRWETSRRPCGRKTRSCALGPRAWRATAHASGIWPMRARAASPTPFFMPWLEPRNSRVSRSGSSRIRRPRAKLASGNLPAPCGPQAR